MQNIYDILANLGIEYVEYKHEAFFTCEQSEDFYNKYPDAGKSKNLFLRNKKGNKHYLVIVEANKRVDLKKLAKDLGEQALSFASPERLMKYLGLTPGSVSPFGLINDGNKEVKVFVDNDLMTHGKLHYHPNINTATLEIKREDLNKFLDYCGNDFAFIEFF